jgi:hypothetical protein
MIVDQLPHAQPTDRMNTGPPRRTGLEQRIFFRSRDAHLQMSDCAWEMSRTLLLV